MSDYLDDHIEEIMANEPDPIKEIDKHMLEELRNNKSFRIIGVMLHETQWRIVNKNLKAGWYPFGNYSEPKEDEPYTLPIRSEIVERLYDLYDKNPHIEISCLVGMNGAGKSTLLDILYRLINNYSVTVLGGKMDNKHGRHLRYADGLNADLYYELGGKLYKVKCRGNETYLYEQDKQGLFTNKLSSKGDLAGFDHFFYTISNNYSLYSLNEKEYKEKTTVVVDGVEKEVRINGNWVEGLFHKNDGYLSPIVITPFREAGSINIEKENGLALQRIAAIAVLGTAHNEPSILDDYRVKAIRYKINRNYKRKIDAKYNESWEEKIKKSYFDRIIEEFANVWKQKLHEKTNALKEIIDKRENFKPTTKEDLVLLYLSYKSFKICMTYDDYYDLLGIDEVLRQSLKEYNDGFFSQFIGEWIQRRKKNFSEVVNRLLNPEYDSHINLKIRQCMNYAENLVYDKDEDEFDIVTLVKGKRVETFDDAVLLLPPAFYNIDLVLEKEKNSVGDNQVVPMTISTMSSGERQMLYTMSYVLYHLKNIQSVKTSNNCHQYNYINLVFDEAELYYHPDYQKQFVKNLIDYISRCHLDNNIIKSINIIIATHSPFVLTDILTQNTLYLDKGNPRVVDNQTFGANYYDMLHDSFFFEDTALGGVATQRIKEWLTGKNEKGESVETLGAEEVQSMIGDPLIVNYLLSGYHVQD